MWALFLPPELAFALPLTRIFFKNEPETELKYSNRHVGTLFTKLNPFTVHEVKSSSGSTIAFY